MLSIKARFLLIVVCLWAVGTGSPGFAQNDFASLTRQRFQRFGAEQGMDNRVIAIKRTSDGYLWVGTSRGLYRYDGYEFKIYTANPGDPTAITDNFVNTLLEDQNGSLWIGTLDGLNRFDSSTEVFHHYQNRQDDSNSLSNDRVLALMEDRQGVIWIGTWGSGISRFDPKTETFTHFKNDPEDPSSLPDNDVWTILEGDDGALWFGTNKGLTRFDNSNNRFELIQDETPDNDASGSQVRTLIQDKQGTIWVGTWGGLKQYNKATGQLKKIYPQLPQRIRTMTEDRDGLLWFATWSGVARLNRETEDIKLFKHDPFDPESLSFDTVWTVYDDPLSEETVIWIGTFGGGGLNKLDTRLPRFGQIRNKPNKTNTLARGPVTQVSRSPDGAYWIGTWGEGLNRFDPRSEQFTQYRTKPNDPTSLSNNVVNSVMVDASGMVWVGTVGGLNRIDPTTGELQRYFSNPENPESMASNLIGVVKQARDDNLWIGTMDSGLNLYDPETGVFKLFAHDPQNPNSLSDNAISSISSDEDGKIWVASSSGGLNHLDPETDISVRYTFQADDPNSLSNNTVWKLFRDTPEYGGWLWVTTNNGLNRMDPQTGKFTVFNVEDGLSHNSATSIIRDQQGYLWIGTGNGLNRMNTETGDITIFKKPDGLPGVAFERHSAYLGEDGLLIFGSENGLNAFYPKDIKSDKRPPAVHLTDFQLANKTVLTSRYDQDSPLKAPIDATDSITLSYKQNVFSFNFAGLHFSDPERNQYAYRMVGFDEEWLTTDGNQRLATYTNLSQGDYTFHVKAANKDGVWNEEGASVQVIITPPPWNTWWARTLYALAVIMVIWWYMRTQQKKLAYERSVVQRLQQLDQLKDDFLANTSHELRTPLNGMIGIVESLIDGVAGQLNTSMRNNLNMVLASGRRLSNLVNDILDFSKLKHHNITLNRRSVDLRAVSDVVLTLCRPLTSHKNIALKNAIQSDIPPVLADENRLQQVLHNLVGNAIKFTEQGYVRVSAELDGNKVIVKVKDTGIGISQDKQERIFSSFEQLEDSDTREHGGTGLGLSITRQLVELHEGIIWVRSAENKGSTFYFTIPIATGEPEPDAEDVGVRSLNRLRQEETNEESPKIIIQQVEGKNDHNFKILLVDDEPVNRQVIANHLSLGPYQIFEAAEGESALKILDQEGNGIDLALLDIMMPRMSGYEVCERLRKRFSDHELPVIFLTAKDRVVDMVTGFEVGANDYLTKPIVKEELLLRVKSHLKLLDTTRHLEDKVRERTLELSHKNKELEDKNETILRTQDQLLMQKKMAMLGTFTAGIAHEINNPNNFISVGVNTLRQKFDQFQDFLHQLAGDEADEEVLGAFDSRFGEMHQLTESIVNGSQRIDRIVRDLRALTRLDEEGLKAVNLVEGLRSAVNLVESLYGDRIYFETVMPEPVVVDCWAAELNQAFMSIILNSCEAICKGNIDTVTSGKLGGIRIIAAKAAGAALLTFEDTGPGISPDIQDKIFEAFYTTKEVGKGTGLGLYNCYRIVEKHGGSIDLKSDLGQGASFFIRLPLAVRGDSSV